MTCEEAQELITALVDQELDVPEQHALEAHLRECSTCSQVAEEEQWTKQILRGRAERLSAPLRLRQSILAEKRIFPESEAPRSLSRSIWIRRAALAAAVLIALALPLFWLQRAGKEPIAAEAIDSYETLARNAVSPVGRETPDELIARLVREAGGHFQPMGYDFSPMGLQPAAGIVQEIHGRKVLVVIYRGKGGTLFCYTFRGAEADVPANAAKFFDPIKQMSFYAFSRAPINAVLHREGELICILASEMPMTDLLALATSKARPS